MVYWVVSLLKALLYKEKTDKKTERTLGTPFLKKTFYKIIFSGKVLCTTENLVSSIGFDRFCDQKSKLTV